MCLDELYPKISFPVSRGTPMIGPLVKLMHTKEWPLVHDLFKAMNFRSSRMIFINARAREWRFITGHVIDGKYGNLSKLQQQQQMKLFNKDKM